MNYSNLSDIEFEYLCKDVMSRKLSKNLQRFGSGKDGGVDLTDDVQSKNIIVQVKHYVKTDVSGLLRSLKNEVAKVEKLKPNKYYVCCSKELTPQNKMEIREMFSSFMESDDYIITSLELDQFLDLSENVDILRKHFKLWIDSSNILCDYFTNDIFIDSEALMAGIEDDMTLFVQTQAYEEAILCLEDRNVLIIVGNPGVGKTVTSKMLVLHYAAQDYRVRYTTDGMDLKELKKSLSQSPKSKEVVLLDDCFGQAYFNMKATQESELLSLIKYISLNKNKVLIMNSRISIYNEAKERTSQLIKSLDKKEYNAYVLNMESISLEDKGKIFYNHLYFQDIPRKYFENIKLDKRYIDIVKHENYNPRIIEFICNPSRIKDINPDKFAEFAIECLDNPEQIWLNEYERRLGKADRMLLTTLYSLTDTTISLDVLKRCFEYRISKSKSIDASINHFKQSLVRLNDSMIKIVDVWGQKKISVANPSINDFLRIYLKNNYPEYNELVGSYCSIMQLERLFDCSEYESRSFQLLSDCSILSFVFESDRQKSDFIAVICAEHQIYNLIYSTYIKEYIFNIHNIILWTHGLYTVDYIIERMFQKEFAEFYGLIPMVKDELNLYKMLENLELEEAVDVIKNIDWIFIGDERQMYITLVQDILTDIIYTYYHKYPAAEYNLDVFDVIEKFTIENEGCEDVNFDLATNYLEETIENKLSEELYEILLKLPNDINYNNKLWKNADITIVGGDKVIENYLQNDYYDDYHVNREKQCIEDEILNYIFDR